MMGKLIGGIVLMALLVSGGGLDGKTARAAKAPGAVLENAAITVRAQSAGVFTVEQKLSISGAARIKDGEVQHVLSKIDGAAVSGLTIEVAGKPVDYQLRDGAALQKLSFIAPPGRDLAYTVKYTVRLQPNRFAIPLLTPQYASAGKSNVVTIDFTAPDGQYIHENSFPILITPPEGNRVVSHLANIPSHIAFSYGAQPNSILNSYNVISVTVFLALLAIIVNWIVLEVKKTKPSAKS